MSARPYSPSVKRPSVEYVVRARVWRYPGPGGWHFVNLSRGQSLDIRRKFGAGVRGWGSIRVLARMGDTEWRTSIFPDAKSKSYLLALKASVRAAERVTVGDRIAVKIRIEVESILEDALRKLEVDR